MYQVDINIPVELKERQKMADQNNSPHRDAKIIWRSGVGLPEDYVRNLPTKPEDLSFDPT